MHQSNSNQSAISLQLNGVKLEIAITLINW